MNTNRKILEQLKNSIETQISKSLRDKCREFNGTDEELKDFFEEIYNKGLDEISSFVKAMVDPKFTRKY